ncbi:MAG: hypothetical protein NZ576_01715 [Bacteroidia bacterium]|nr:hypothetical protein [Bacteroidia bacterium]
MRGEGSNNNNNELQYKSWLRQFEEAVVQNQTSILHNYFVSEAEALQIANLYKHLIPEIAVREYIPLMAKQIHYKSDSSYQVVLSRFVSKAQRVEWISFEETTENNQKFVALTVSFVVGGRTYKHKLAGIIINDEFNILEIQ